MLEPLEPNFELRRQTHKLCSNCCSVAEYYNGINCWNCGFNEKWGFKQRIWFRIKKFIKKLVTLG